jgi:hypothetical protein
MSANYAGALSSRECNKAVDPIRPDLPFRVMQRQIKRKCVSSQRYCKAFAIGRKNAGNAVEWQRRVTGVQHSRMNGGE